MAGHRSPRGGSTQAHSQQWHPDVVVMSGPAREGSRRARHQSAHRPAPTGPSLRTTVLAGAAAAGAVATGTFTALVPTSGTELASTAVADETAMTATLASSAAPLQIQTASVSAGFFSPVSIHDAPSVTTPGGGESASVDQHLAGLGKGYDIAAELAEQHKLEAEKARLDAAIAKGGVDGWIAEALRILDMPQSYAAGVKKIIMAESGGNPRAINNWDSNARRGTPSQGLMQTIPSTFKAYVHPDLADRPITDPVANITAGIRYMVDTYGEGTLHGGGRTNSSGDYVGY